MSPATDDPFTVDELRKDYARRGDLTGLRRTYDGGAYPELADLSSAELWDDLASFNEVPAFRIRRLRAVADLVPPGASVLDIGVGWGEIVPMILARGGTRYTGIDFSDKIVARVAARHPECRFVTGGIDQLDGPFDVILALEVCEHLLPSRILGFLGRVHELLAPGGRLIVTVPVYENLKAMTLRCPSCGHMHNRVGHVRSYSPELIRAELSLSGFETLESFFIYASFDHDVRGRLKRAVVDIGRSLLRMGRTMPLNIVVLARRT